MNQNELNLPPLPLGQRWKVEKSGSRYYIFLQSRRRTVWRPWLSYKTLESSRIGTHECSWGDDYWTNPKPEQLKSKTEQAAKDVMRNFKTRLSSNKKREEVHKEILGVYEPRKS